ncbi:MAG: MerR family transcriptional regulator [Desulfuromonadaceae bacterium]|nr:MerR family transcriptional regulator [Desulfuromonadaceae bacterium]
MTDTHLFSISEIERETGLARDTLRVWERRYGYPLPLRNELGERKYDGEQLNRLRLIKRLMDSGLQPGKLIPLDNRQLQQLMVSPGTFSSEVEEVLYILASGALHLLTPCLKELQRRHGLRNFLTDVVAPLNEAVGEAWFSGRIGVRDEHYYTEQLRRVLLPVSFPKEEFKETALRTLLTTLPGEPHGIGLLMVDCTLSQEGVEVFPLGVQTPLDEIVQGAVGNQCHIVGISCSEYMNRRTLAAQLVSLRKLLPENITLWVGGSGVRNMTLLDKHIRIFTGLYQLPEAVSAEISARVLRSRATSQHQ